MLSFERINYDEVDWQELAGFHDSSVCQTRPWMEYVAECQGGEPVVARVLDNGVPVGYFTGMIIKKFGMPILGSPFPGWTTLYMGFNLPPGFDRLRAVRALPQFAFDGLGCIHLELLDRFVTMEQAEGLGWQLRGLKNREIDLSQPRDDIWSQMGRSSARWGVKKAEKSGVVIEEVPATDTDFAAEYVEQMRDVFAKQGLAPTYGLTRVESLIRHLHPAGLLLTVRARDPEGNRLATGLFPGHGAMAYFWGGASLRCYQKLRPNDAMQWHAIRYWQDRGCTRYDFGGGGAYKKKYGGYEIEVPWLRRSRYTILEYGRKLARRWVDTLQRMKGRSAK